jgi:CelD/BcsL family acetyltransferase involved in cellulose biosynthesis
VGQTAETLVHARAPLPVETHPPARAAAADQRKIVLSVHTDLGAVEADWRKLEATADCTPFQAFDWLSAWHRHIGRLTGTRPAIVIGRCGEEILFLLPLAVERRMLARCLVFLGQDLCDYNAPLLAPEFSQVIGSGFTALLDDIRALLQATPGLRHDAVAFEKMPATIGAQDNPLLCLNVRLNPSGAYEAALGSDWEQFYASKRSSATRRRDRTKLKRLGELGEVSFVNPATAAETALTLDALVQQKSKAFGRMGVANMFARPGHAAFFRELATAPRMRGLVHLSRLDVGGTWAAINLGLTFHDCYYHVLASYDDGETSRFGPGAAHLRDLLKYAIERGLKRFDFTIGDEPYKRDWCESEQKLYDHFAAVTMRGVPLTVMSLAQRTAKRLIKQSAPLWNMVVRVRAVIASLRKQPDP